MSDKEIGYQGIEPGDLVVHGMDGFAGSIGISDSRGKGSPILNVLDSNEDKYYMMYYLRAMAYGNVFTAIATGIRVRSCDLRWPKLANLPYPIPAIKEQRAIADFLDKQCAAIDEAIEKHKKVISRLEEFERSIIYKTITLGLNKSVTLKDTQIGWAPKIPESWSPRRLKYTVSIENGSDPVLQGNIPVYGSGARSFKTCGEYKDAPTVLIGRKGATLHIPHYINHPYWNVDTAFNTKPVNNTDLKWFYYAARCFDYAFYINQTTLPSMTQTDYGNMVIPTPPVCEQKEIAEYLDKEVERVTKAKNVHNNIIAKLEEYRKSIIYNAVTGKIDCRKEQQ